MASGEVAPGLTTGDLTVSGNVSFNPGSTLRIDLNDGSAPKKDLLAVVGPKRMNYEKVVPIVDITAKLLSNALSQY